MDSRCSPYAVGVRALVAIDLASAVDVAAHTLAEWDADNAVLVVDQRLPERAKESLFSALAVHEVIDAGGRTRLHPGAQTMNPNDALVVATSGTSGEPKGVVHTHDGLRAASLASAAALRCGAEAHWLACLPLAHIGGFGVLTRAWHTGATLTVHDGFDAESVARTEATHVSLVATALARIDPSRFARILLGGSRPPATIPGNATVTYGLTESCGGVVYDRRPIPGVSVRIADDGEVLLRGPMMMSGYRNSNLPSPIDDEGWLHTNDIGHLDTGLLVVEGRRGDLIVSGGEKIWPDAVEQVLATHPRVRECAVAGVVDAEWGQRVVAWIVASDATAPSLAEIRDHVATELPRYCAPREVVVVKELPRTSLGKVLRRSLIDQLRSNE